MDVEKLFTLIPKEPRRWNQEDVSKWLNFIDLADLIQILFVDQNAIDGSCIEVLDEGNLNELGVQSNIKKKKLIQWIQKGFPEFKQYVRQRKGKEEWCIDSQIVQSNHTLQNQGSIRTIQQQQNGYYSQKDIQEFQEDGIKRLDQTDEKKPNFQEQFQHQELIESQQIMEPPKIHTNINNDLLATVLPQQKLPIPVKQQVTMMLMDDANKKYTIDESGIKIGRGQDNGIILQEDYISRNHCKIIFKDEKFFLQDLGSTAGTFVRLTKPTILRQNLIIQMGSAQYNICTLDFRQNYYCDVILLSIEGYQEGQTFQFQLIKNSTQVIFGRSLEMFRDDPLLSTQHAKFTYSDEGLILEDLQSRNGTWFRLSAVAQQGEPVRLFQGRVFRLGFDKYFGCE